MSSAITISALTAALIGTGLWLGLWLRRESQRADLAERALGESRATVELLEDRVVQVLRQIDDLTAIHDAEMVILVARIAAADAALAQCRDPETVRRLLQEALNGV